MIAMITSLGIGDYVRYIGTEGDVWGEVVGVHGGSVDVRWYCYGPVPDHADEKLDGDGFEEGNYASGELVQLIVETVPETLLVRMEDKPCRSRSLALARQRYIDWAVDRLVEAWERGETVGVLLGSLSHGDKGLMAQVRAGFRQRTDEV